MRDHAGKAELSPRSVSWGGKILTLEEIVARAVLESPDTRKCLGWSADRQYLVCDEEQFASPLGGAMLYPAAVQTALVNGVLPLVEYDSDPLLQYCLLSQLKNRGETNSSWDSAPVKLHHQRLRLVTRELTGWVLDVGSGSVAQSARLVPSHCEFTGVDAYGPEEGKILAMAEILPFAGDTFDAVMFNTSLDHILDYRTAIAEALRVLKPGGALVVASLAWTGNATLLTDNVHFHHMTEALILDGIRPAKLEKVLNFPDPKGLSHRFGMYVVARKTALQG